MKTEKLETIKKIYLVSEYDNWLMRDSQVVLGVFDNIDIAIEAIKEKYGEMEESDEFIQNYLQMTPIEKNVKIGIEAYPINVI